MRVPLLATVWNENKRMFTPVATMFKVFGEKGDQGVGMIKYFKNQV